MGMSRWLRHDFHNFRIALRYKFRTFGFSLGNKIAKIGINFGIFAQDVIESSNIHHEYLL